VRLRFFGQSYLDPVEAFRGDWTSVTLGERAGATEDTEETCGLKKEDVESRTCRGASGKRGGPPQKVVGTK